MLIISRPFVAIARFCEAIIDFLADEQRAESSGITPAQFEGEVYSAYDTLFNVWLLAKDARVSLLLPYLKKTDICSLFVIYLY